MDCDEEKVIVGTKIFNLSEIFGKKKNKVKKENINNKI